MPRTNPRKRVGTLLDLARARFGGLSQAETALLRAAAKGETATCGPSADVNDPTNDPANAEKDWGPDREIRAELIRWLCVHTEAASRVDPRGIRFLGAKITGKLDLSFADVPFLLALLKCRLTANVNLGSSSIPALNLAGSWVGGIFASGANIKGNAFLRDGFTAEGEVWLLGAQIRGDLDCSNGTFKNPPQQGLSQSGVALNADRANVAGSVLVREGFTAEGEVRFLGTQIGGDLDCSGGTFKNPSPEAISQEGRKALNADRAKVGGSVFLRERFSADGVVWLLGIQIGGNLSCRAGKFAELVAQAAIIRGSLFLSNLQDVENMTIDVKQAVAGPLVDDKKSWPARGKLHLDGFEYKRISEGPSDAGTRLEWLRRQDPFMLQPYRQLAKVLLDAGDERGARSVLYEMERSRRGEQDRSWRARVWGWVLKATVGYGFYPELAVLWLLALILLGWWLFGTGYDRGSVTPTGKDAYAQFKNQGQLPDHYQRFNALIYSLENSVPLVKLGQTDYWTPDPSPQVSRQTPLVNSPSSSRLSRIKAFAQRLLAWVTASGFLRWFRWGQILVGWILATLFVAGVTGVVRKE